MIRAATPADVAKFYPEERLSFRAWVGEVDGEARGIAGIIYSAPKPVLFSKFEDEYRPFLRRFAVWKLIRKIITVLDDMKVPVIAINEPGEETSPGLLQKLGFVRISSLSDEIDLYERRPR